MLCKRESQSNEYTALPPKSTHIDEFQISKSLQNNRQFQYSFSVLQ